MRRADVKTFVREEMNVLMAVGLSPDGMTEAEARAQGVWETLKALGSEGFISAKGATYVLSPAGRHLHDHFAERGWKNPHVVWRAILAVPPAAQRRTTGMHWLNIVNFDGHPEGLIALQWNASSETWSHSNDHGTEKPGIHTGGYVYVAPIAMPSLDTEDDLIRKVAVDFEDIDLRDFALGHHACLARNTQSFSGKVNPIGVCVYDDAEDGIHDFCLYCGHPEERK